MLTIFVETRFHLSLTVTFWFREKYSCVKLLRDFWMIRWSALFSYDLFSFRAMFAFG